jgi:hypothetical protein
LCRYIPLEWADNATSLAQYYVNTKHWDAAETLVLAAGVGVAL